MQSRDKDNTEKEKELNSIQKSWTSKGGSREQWLKLREDAINRAVEVYKAKTDMPLRDLYAFLTEQRAIISEDLSQGITREIKQNRSDPRFAMGSTKMYGSVYEHFRQSLVEEFDRLAITNVQINEIDVKNDKFTDPLTINHVLRMKQNEIKTEKIPFLTIELNGIEYSSLYKVTLPDGEPAIVIVHTDGLQLNKIMEVVNDLNDSLKHEKNPEEKIRIIKKIAWYLFQAMPQKRGSAAIGEMVMETLLRANDINYDSIHVAGGIEAPYDIIALFTKSPEEFVNKITINLIDEHELSKSKKDASEENGVTVTETQPKEIVLDKEQTSTSQRDPIAKVVIKNFKIDMDSLNIALKETKNSLYYVLVDEDTGPALYVCNKENAGKMIANPSFNGKIKAQGHLSLADDGTILDLDGINLENKASLSNIMNVLNYFYGVGINIDNAQLITKTDPATVGYDKTKTSVDQKGQYHSNAKELGEYLKTKLQNELIQQTESLLKAVSYYPEDTSLQKATSKDRVAPITLNEIDQKKISKALIDTLQILNSSTDLQGIERAMNALENVLNDSALMTQNSNINQDTRTQEVLSAQIQRFNDIKQRYQTITQDTSRVKLEQDDISTSPRMGKS